jgi:AP-3 complex subunit mu
MPKAVLNVNLNASQGKYSFDSSNKQLSWDVGRIDCNKSPSLKGSITLQSGQPLPDSNPTILIKFMMNQVAASGLKVNRLDLYGEVSTCI